jgi:hypothetical protein
MRSGKADERDDVIVRKAEHGWVVGKENVSDLTSAMVLADLFAADQTGDEDTRLVSDVDRGDAARQQATFVKNESTEAERLAVTVTQLEHALASRVRVEQAIGILAERHRLRPREAFDLLRKASRARGRRVTELAHDVVESAANPLLRLPDELARTVPEPRQRESRQRGRSTRRGRHAM